MLAAVADQMGIRYVELRGVRQSHPRSRCGGRVDARYRDRVASLPIETDSLGRLVVAVDDPLDDGRHGRLRQAAHGEVVLALAHREELMRAIDNAYDVATIAADRPAQVLGASEREAATMTQPSTTCSLNFSGTMGLTCT